MSRRFIWAAAAGALLGNAVAIEASVGNLVPPAHASARGPELSPQDFAWRVQVLGTDDSSAAYRVSVPLSVYQKVVHPDLADLRVFNSNAQAVPFALEHPVTGTSTPETARSPVFPLKDASNAALDAVCVTIAAGKAAVKVQTGASMARGRINAYLVDGRTFDVPVSALSLEWAADAVDFAGRLNVEASDNLRDWRMLTAAAPIANLKANGARLVERRVELQPTRAKFWRLSWAGPLAPFELTSVLAEQAKRNLDAPRTSLSVVGHAVPSAPGEFEFDLGASPPIDRLNIELPELNTVTELVVLSRARQDDPWRTVLHKGFYRLKGEGTELRNGAVPIEVTSDRHWLVRADKRGGGVGSGALSLSVAWVPHEVIFLARGATPFSIAYGSASASAAAVSLADIPKNVSIGRASLASPQLSGGEARLLPSPAPLPWKKAILWALLVIGAALLAWMAYRLSRDMR